MTEASGTFKNYRYPDEQFEITNFKKLPKKRQKIMKKKRP